MEQGLRVRIGVDVAGLQKGFAEATKNAQGFAKAASSSVSSSLKQITANATETAKAASGLGESFAGATAPAAIVAAAVVALGSELLNYKSIAEQAKETQKAVNLEIEKSVASTAGEIAQLKSLISIATNESNSRETRNEAIKQLNKQYPDTFSNYDFEKQDLAKLTELTDKLTASIQKRARAKALQNQIDASANRVLELQNNKLEKSVSTLDLVGIFAKNFLNTGGALSDALSNVNTQIQAENELQKRLAAELTNVNTELAVNGNLYTDKPKKIKETADRTKDLADITGELTKKLNAISSKEDLLDLNLNTERISAYKTALDSLLKIGVSPTNEILKQIAENIKILESKNLGGIAEGLKKITGAPVATPGNQTGRPVTGLTDKFFDTTNAADNLKKRTLELAEIFNNVLGPAIDNAFQAAITGSQSFSEAFSNALRNVIVQLTATLAKALALAVILSAVSGGKLSFGNAFKGLLSGKLPQLASGGKASGPSSGYLAVLHGTEYVFNQDQMRALGNMLNSGVSIDFPDYVPVMRGDDIFLSYNRTAIRKARNL